MKLLTIIAALGLKPDQEHLPEWFCIFPEGKNEVEGVGTYLVDHASWKVVQARLVRRGVDIVFDYEHQTLADVKAPAAGWCREWRYSEGIGIEARIKWTEEAAGYLAKGEYRYFSPVFNIRQEDKRLVAVHSVALTNAPRTNNIKPLLAKLGAELNKENGMDSLKIMIAALKLKEDATEDDVVAAVAELQKQSPVEVVSKAVVDALGVDTNDESTVVASIHALKQTEKTMVSKADFDALTRTLAKRDGDEIVAKAMSDGKITPDQKEWAEEYAGRDLNGFKTFVSKAPVVIPIRKLPEGQTKAEQDALSDSVLAVAKLMDVSAEDLKEYGQINEG
jgi:phage I-like protein